MPKTARPPKGSKKRHRTGRKRRLRKLLEFKDIPEDLNGNLDAVQKVYDGPAGAVLSMASLVSLHEPLVGHLLRSKRFDVSRFENILDVGSGAGQILGHLLKTSRPSARLVAFDLSTEMLRRAKTRLRDRRPAYVSGDITRLPFAERSFDCITCGWVLEHLTDPTPALREFERVLQPGGSLLLLATEDTVTGAFCSRTWKCRTYNRAELKQACTDAGLGWEEEFWLTPVHRLLKVGGILVEATKPDPGDAMLNVA